MPDKDGTGPRFRRRGFCRNLYDMVPGNTSSKKILWSSITLPLLSAVVRDITNPEGIIPNIIRKVFNISSKKELPKDSNQNNVIEGEYEIIEDKKEEK